MQALVKADRDGFYAQEQSFREAAQAARLAASLRW